MSFVINKVAGFTELSSSSLSVSGIVSGFTSLNKSALVELHPDAGSWTITSGAASSMIANSRATMLNKQLQNPYGSVSISGFSLSTTSDTNALEGDNVTLSKDGLTKRGITKRISFIHTGQILEIAFSATLASTFFIKVDGKYESLTAITQLAANRYRKYDFGTSDTRRIDIISQGVNEVFNPSIIFVEPTDSIYKAAIRGPRCIIIDDSFGAQQESWPFAFAEALQWDDVWGSGSPGSGYINDLGGTLQTYGERLQTDVIDHSPDVVIVAGSGNDNTSSYNDIYAAALSVYNRLTAALPNAIIVSADHPLDGVDEITSNGFRNVAARKQAAADAGIIFINPGQPEGFEFAMTTSASEAIGSTFINTNLPWVGALREGLTGSSVYFGDDAAGTGERYYITGLINAANTVGLIINGTGGSGLRTAYASGTAINIVGASFIVGRDGDATYGNADAAIISAHPTIPIGRDLLGKVIAQEFIDALIKAAK